MRSSTSSGTPHCACFGRPARLHCACAALDVLWKSTASPQCGSRPLGPTCYTDPPKGNPPTTIPLPLYIYPPITTPDLHIPRRRSRGVKDFRARSRGAPFRAR
ncbi:hypothetical protein chiPu_0020002 [Chiloscyllium punctatum]|uniref:Uncharacterized protein n=1 Tax=Chiloscyllium punctatum TaxID=137246 RepID=A0A401RTS1_CHIPU|nr:hypothetical protein [Chiloscyllium punctatum]